MKTRSGYGPLEWTVAGALVMLGVFVMARELLPAAPAEDALAWHRGRISEMRVDTYGRDGTRQQRWRIEGLERSLYHRRRLATSP